MFRLRALSIGLVLALLLVPAATRVTQVLESGSAPTHQLGGFQKSVNAPPDPVSIAPVIVARSTAVGQPPIAPRRHVAVDDVPPVDRFVSDPTGLRAPPRAL